MPSECSSEYSQPLVLSTLEHLLVTPEHSLRVINGGGEDRAAPDVEGDQWFDFV